MKQRFFLLFLPMMVMSLLVSCGTGSDKGHRLPEGDTLALKYATNLTMVDYGDFVKADFRNPWDTTKTLQSFVLVPRDMPLPENLPSGTVVRTPIQSSVIYTSVHGSLIDELGKGAAIKGVCDAKYVTSPALRERISNGEIADCGNSMAPNIEQILMLKPEAILLSAFENSNDHNKVAQTGIPIIDCTDYMETSPLARAEWMRFYGRLFGCGDKADSLFDATERAYLSIKDAMSEVPERPMVLSELIYGQSWAVPAALSTVGVLINDAGGYNPFDAYKRTGSVQLSPEEVLYRAKDADIWLVKYSLTQEPRLSQMAADQPIYSKFRAFSNGRVYGCDTSATGYFDDVAFHPHWILAELAELFHPEIALSDINHHYYKILQQ